MAGLEIITSRGRSLQEIVYSIRRSQTDMVRSAVDIGLDLIEAKEACGHGEWLSFLKETGLSHTTASNYMKVAREVSAGSEMARLPYTKILAILSMPEEDRDEIVKMAEDMSAAEIRRLTEERNRAAEAVNAETARADAAEATAKDYHDRIESLNVQIHDLKIKAEYAYQQGQDDTVNRNRELQKQIDLLSVEKQALQEKAEQLRAKLLTAENNRVEVEVPPADYDAVKAQLEAARRSAQDLISAAAEAEDRAAEAEARLEAIRSGQDPAKAPAQIILSRALSAFYSECELMPWNPGELQDGRQPILEAVAGLETWCGRMRAALDAAVPGEGAVR